MKYSILGFNQEKVLQFQREEMHNGKAKLISIDVIDLIILREISDFMNRKKIIKYIVDDKTFCYVKYSVIIDDLPIINIKQQALVDRLDKLCSFGFLEKHVVKNQAGSFPAFRIGEAYEMIAYSDDSLHTYQNTSANVSKYKCNIINNNNNSNNCIENNNQSTINKEEKEIDKSISKKGDELFETCWVAYRRKGSKKKSIEYWKKISDKEKEHILPHIKAYVQSREIQYQKDFERYLRDKIYQTVVFSSNKVVYDPTKGNSGTYTPICGGALSWNDYYNCYMYVGYWDGRHIADGYNDDNRPHCATITLNNGRGTITWNRNTKQWEKV